MIDRFVLDELSIVMVELKCSSPFSLEIVSTSWHIVSDLRSTGFSDTALCIFLLHLSFLTWKNNRHCRQFRLWQTVNFVFCWIVQMNKTQPFCLVHLNTDDCATICNSIIPRKCLSEGVGAPVGSLIVKWKRSKRAE